MRTPRVQAMEAGAMAACAALAGLLAWRGGAAMLRPWIFWPGMLAGYVAADAASGLVHWFCDNCFREDTPVIGALLIQPFRAHHRDPGGITTHGFLELCGNSCLGLLPAMAAAAWFAERVPALLNAALLSFFAAMFLTNQFHKWAHAEQVPRVVAWLQRRRVILAPDVHSEHHGNGHGSAYCITSGWMNWALDQLVGAR